MGLSKLERRTRIRKRIRKIVSGVPERPRFSVFRSNKEIYVQIIDDHSGNTLVAGSSRDKDIVSKKGTKVEKAALTGEKIAKLALKKGIKEVVFDRGGNLYHGRIKSLAEGARKGGLKF